MNFRFKATFKDIFLTFITQAIVLVGFFIVYRLIAKNFGPEGVGKYSLVRRVIAFFNPLLLLGFGIGFPRYIAMSKDKNQRSCYIKAAATVVISFAILFLLIINFFKIYFAKIFFGNISHVNCVLPFSFLLAGIILHSLVYFYLQGRLFVKTFNLLQITNLIVLPLAVLIFFRGISMERLIALLGIATFIIAFVFSLFFIKEFFASTKKWQLKNSLKKLLFYSVPRVPGDLASGVLFSLGPILAAHFTSIQETGYLSVSQNLSNIVGAAIAPLGLILLPKISNLITQDRQEIVKENINFLITGIFQCFFFVCVQLVIFTDTIVGYWLGSEFFSAIPVMRIVFLSTFFYAFYVAMKSILDATTVKPLNAINISISLLIFLLLSGVLLLIFKPFSPIVSLSIAFTSGLICLGVLTYLCIRKIYPENRKKDLNCLVIAISINTLLGAIAILVKPLVTSKLYWLILFEVLIGVVYLSILSLLKMDWLEEIPRIIKTG